MTIPSTSTGGNTADLSGFTSDQGAAYPANHPFWLVHFGDEPGTWDPVPVDGVTYWLPNLTPWILKEGTNGVRMSQPGGSGPERIMVARTIIEERRGTIIDMAAPVPDDCLPPNVAPGGALRTWKVRNGTHYALVWDQPRPQLGGGEFVPKHYADEYNRWRLHLVTSGQVKPPSDAMLDSTRATIAGRTAGIRTRASADPSAESRDRQVTSAKALENAATVAVDPSKAPPKKARTKAAEATA